MFAGFRRRFRPFLTFSLTCVWIMLMGQLSWANVLGGLGVALAVVLLLPLPAMPIEDLSIHWFRLFSLILRWLWNLMKASVKVAYLALRRTPPPQTAILKVPMRVQSEFVLFLGTVLYNLQPGGSVSDIDIANRMWTIHILDASSPAAIDYEIAQVAELERRLINTFERV